MRHRDLIRAYLTTRYVAYDDGREVAVRIRRRSQPMDDLLSRLSATSGIFITAWNPPSEILPEEENREAAQRLQSALGRRGLSALPHCGFDADPARPEERRVGKACVSTRRSRLSPDLDNKSTINHTGRH